MKKLITLLSLLCTGHYFTQTQFNRAYHDINEKPVPVLAGIYGDTYFVTQSYDFPCGQAYLYRHNNGNGALKFRLAIQPGVKTALISKDNKLLLTGSNLTYASGNGLNLVLQCFITKLDTNGAAIFTSTYTTNLFNKINACLQYSDSSYFSFTDSVILKHSKTGQQLLRLNQGLREMSSAIVLPNSNILISAKQASVTTLIEMDATGNIVGTHSFPVLLSKMINYGGQKIMGLGSDGKIYKLSSSFSSAGVSAQASVTDFMCHLDTVYAIGNPTGQLPFYRVMDTLFNTVAFSITNANKIQQEAICYVTPNRVAILSSAETSYQYPFSHYHASLSVLNRLSANNFNNEISLLAVTADSVYANCIGAYCASYIKARFQVKNMGSSPVNTFKLNLFDSPSSGECGTFIRQEQFSGVALQPGQTKTFTTQSFVAKSHILPVTTPTFTQEFCFYVSLPNGETDPDPLDDKACVTKELIVTGIERQYKQEAAVKIFPNPFENSLSLESDALIKAVSLTNTLGMQLHSSAVNRMQATLSFSDLTPGIYLINIKTEKGTVIKKVVKE